MHSFSTPSVHFATSLKHSPMPQACLTIVGRGVGTADSGLQLPAVQGFLSSQSIAGPLMHSPSGQLGRCTDLHQSMAHHFPARLRAFLIKAFEHVALLGCLSVLIKLTRDRLGTVIIFKRAIISVLAAVVFASVADFESRSRASNYSATTPLHPRPKWRLSKATMLKRLHRGS